MATFDYDSFLTLTGKGKGTFGALATSFGVPSCLLNIGEKILNALPSGLLGGILEDIQGGKDKADQESKDIFSKIRLQLGLIEFDTEDGLFFWKSNSSKAGLDDNQESFLGGLIGTIDALGKAGGRIYTKVQDLQSEMAEIQACIGNYIDYLSMQSGHSSTQKEVEPGAAQDNVVREYATEILQLAEVTKFITTADKQIALIEDVLADRILNDTEPCFNPSVTYGKGKTILDLTPLSAFGFCVDTPKAQERIELIRLVFGPPKTRQGQFLLSVDGLYYDSQVSGVIPVLTELTDRHKEVKFSERWKFEHDSSLGGKGDSVSTRNIIDYVDTLFDPDLISESKNLQKFYNADHFLQVLTQNKEKRILDLSSHIVDMQDAGESLAIIENTQQSVFSEIAQFDTKIRRRKKQIELAVDGPRLIAGKASPFKPGGVPINDFSYLQEYHFTFDINKQKELILDQDDVSGVVLPLFPTFVVNPGNAENTTIDHLYIPRVGIGDILTSDSSAMGQEAPTQSLTDVITTQNLISVYNFLGSQVETPSSTNFQVIDCAHEGSSLRMQLVGETPSSIFYSGLGIPYFEGITKNSGATPTGLGSYAKLPDQAAFQDLTFNPNGFSFETWFHSPNLTASNSWGHNVEASSLYRLMLSCENTGIKAGTDPQEDILRLGIDKSGNVNRGMMMGFTCDRRITLDQGPSNDTTQNSPPSSLAFFIAPTQSYDDSSIGLLNWPRQGGCASSNTYRSMTITSSIAGADGARITDACSSFMHLVVSVDTHRDELKVYLDKTLMTTSSVADVFGTEKYTPIKIPNYSSRRSFEYSSTTVKSNSTDAIVPRVLTEGPRLYDHSAPSNRLYHYLTPWIIGGGYTDGMMWAFTKANILSQNFVYDTPAGNFMGGEWGGVLSGFRGHMGSTKFYSKVLDIEEITKNYDGQKKFFKNIDVGDTC